MQEFKGELLCSIRNSLRTPSKYWPPEENTAREVCGQAKEGARCWTENALASLEPDYRSGRA